jgi:hypothetical protein
MRYVTLASFAFAMGIVAPSYAQAPASGAAPTPPPLPAPADTSSGPASYVPSTATQSATTHPQPSEELVWRLVDPTEADWHSPDPNRPRGWARVDTDVNNTTFYVGGSFRLADGLAFAPFAHLSGAVAEPNLAVTWQTGGLWIMPALGTSFDFATTQAKSLDPQLFVALDAKLIYLEGWAQYFVASLYHPGTRDVFAARVMLLVSLGSTFGVGVEYDPTVATRHGPSDALLSSIFGGRVNVRIGAHDTVGLFLGYQTAAQARGSFDGVAGRFEFVHQW